MAAALSVDLRARVVSACLEEGFTYQEAAEHFGVGYASVSRWLRRYRETEQLAPLPLPGRTPRIDAEGLEHVRRLVAAHPDATLKELAAAYVGEGQVPLALCIMHRALAKLGLSRKKRRSTPRNESVTTSAFFGGTTSLPGLALVSAGSFSSMKVE